jgi:hypothetical protein
MISRQVCAGSEPLHPIERTVVVVAVPHAPQEVASVADEPGVAIRVGRSSLARRLDVVKHRALRGALFDHFVHHHGHVGSDLRRNCPN